MAINTSQAILNFTDKMMFLFTKQIKLKKILRTILQTKCPSTLQTTKLAMVVIPYNKVIHIQIVYIHIVYILTTFKGGVYITFNG